MEKYELQKKGAPPSTSVLQVMQSRYWGRSSENLPQNLSVSPADKYELSLWYTRKQGGYLNYQCMHNYLARLHVDFCEYRDVCICPSKVNGILDSFHKSKEKLFINIIIFKIMLPILHWLFQLFCSIHSSLMYNTFGTFFWVLSVTIVTVTQAADGGGAGFTQIALAALHTGLLGTGQFK